MTLDGFSLNLLAGTAAIAITHTLLGPDHYLPFVMMAHAGRWSRTKTAWVTAVDRSKAGPQRLRHRCGTAARAR